MLLPVPVDIFAARGDKLIDHAAVIRGPKTCIRTPSRESDGQNSFNIFDITSCCAHDTLSQ